MAGLGQLGRGRGTEGAQRTSQGENGDPSPSCWLSGTCRTDLPGKPLGAEVPTQGPAGGTPKSELCAAAQVSRPAAVFLTQEEARK